MNVRGHCNSAAAARLQLPLFPLFGGKFREFPSAPPPLARSLRSPSIFHNLKVKAVIRDRRDALSDAPRPAGQVVFLAHSQLTRPSVDGSDRKRGRLPFASSPDKLQNSSLDKFIIETTTTHSLHFMFQHSYFR